MQQIIRPTLLKLRQMIGQRLLTDTIMDYRLTTKNKSKVECALTFVLRKPKNSLGYL